MRPGPGFVAVCTLIMSAFLSVFLLELTASAVYTARLGSAAITRQASLGTGSASAQQQSDQAAAASSEGCAVSASFPQSILQWCSLITRYAGKHSLPPDLIAALIWQESGGNPAAYSNSGAVGLMQVMPSDGRAASFSCANGPCFSDRPSTDQLKQPEFNISYGTKMLGGLVARYGGIREALKSYGPMNVGYYYADKVLGLLQRYGKSNQ